MIVIGGRAPGSPTRSTPGRVGGFPFLGQPLRCLLALLTFELPNRLVAQQKQNAALGHPLVTYSRLLRNTSCVKRAGLPRKVQFEW